MLASLLLPGVPIFLTTYNRIYPSAAEAAHLAGLARDTTFSKDAEAGIHAGKLMELSHIADHMTRTIKAMVQSIGKVMGLSVVAGQVQENRPQTA